ncbi:hypothetical protein KUL72_07390 [Bradyrhizobium arachidis]|uniref:hypothetical protein n=1 Tax=Bradyrhizobium TaxID=374 RepID=UPI002163B554|nr:MULTISPECIES: hypothetical protein [Bradyrhizobium]MDN4986486.1 hypothetical protein [Bradyrhizobium sp. WYCCWR 13022]UVO38184.1 hypothetical protein KUL72_07390 [Bradyrhizobium arachidis]
MAAKPPTKDFGKRRPAPVPPAPREPVKRSGHVALLVMGTIAVGSTAFMLMPRQACDPAPAGTTPPGATTPAPATTNCSSSSRSSSGSSHWSSRSSFYSSDSSSYSSSGGSSEAGSGGVTRGGFGSFAHAFSGGS